MRIFIASGIFHPDSGGPATYLYRLLPELLQRGHTVRVLTYGNAPTDGYPYPLRRIPFGREPLTRWLRYALAYRAESARADLVYVNTLGLPRFGDASRPRLLKIVGDYAWERCINRGWLPPNEDIDAFQTKRYAAHVAFYKAARAREARTADQVIVPSEYLRRMVIGWGAAPERVHVIYNALETDHYAVEASRESARMALDLPVGAKVLVTAARLTAWKGVDYLIDALPALPDVTLVIAGDGPELAALQQRAVQRGVADRARFLGKVPHEKMALLLRAADYLALYSGYEGLSHTILEALYAGTPVIASNRGGNPEVVRDGVNGLLVPHPDLPALIDGIRRAFADGTPARLAAGTSAGLDRFAWPALVEQTVSVITRTAALRR
jgi:glycosyltransferase involved in cell wall biosynthesis